LAYLRRFLSRWQLTLSPMTRSQIQLLAGLAICCLPGEVTLAQERVIPVSGEYAFGPQVSQEQACLKAEVRAKEEGLRKAFGETHFTHKLLECSGADNQTCEYQRVSVSALNGVLLNFSERRQSVRDDLGMRVCRVTGRAHLDASRSPNKDLYFDVRLNRHLYRVGDEVSIEILAPGKSFLAVFAQSDSSGRRVTRVFPNRHVLSAEVTDKLILPGKDTSYRLSVATGSGSSEKRSGSLTDGVARADIGTTADVEYLYVIRTTSSVKWLESYALDDLLKHLSQIDIDQRLVRVAPYRVMR